MRGQSPRFKWHEGILLVAAAMALAAAPAVAQAVHGSGTVHHIPRWTDSSTIGDSVLSQSGGNLTTGSSLSVGGTLSAGTVDSTSPYQIGGTNVLSVAGSNNLFAGQSAGAGNTTGSSNTAIGAQALQANTVGAGNTAIGAQALQANTTAGILAGEGNTAVGNYALWVNTTGPYNTAIGLLAMRSNTTGGTNTAIGNLALAQNTSGYDNIGVGLNTLPDLTTGAFNVALGDTAGISLDGSPMTSTGNMFLGLASGASTGTITNATAIGNHAIVGASNSLVLGAINGVNQATATTNVGIGTTTPDHVFTIGQGAGHAISDGWDTYSSRLFKTNIQTLEGALEKVQQLRGVSYDSEVGGKHEIGVIAEEVGQVVPEVVSYAQNGVDAQGVDYSRLTALLIEAVKSQQAEILELKQRIEQLTSNAAGK